MTPRPLEDFLALPDREKDALIAEKVMGWHLTDDGQNWQLPDCRVPVIDYDEYGQEFKAWSPSTDISAAWDVAEKIKDKIFGIWPEREPGLKNWSVTLNAVDSYSGVESFEHDRIEMAICMAALGAVGVIK